MAKISINIATGSIQPQETIVGIDLGTTNSLVALMHPQTRQPIALKDVDGAVLVPSIVHFGTDDQITVGLQALEYLESDPARTIYSVKRLLGKSYRDVAEKNEYYSYRIIDEDENKLVKIQVGSKFYSPTELSSFILKELKHRAEHVLKTSIQKCVITVPAFFNDAQRQATRDAGKLAGLEVLRIINEPTAASLAYGLGTLRDESKLIAVYDLGGGTFDISILRLTEGIFEVLSTHGDTYLGGDDLDLALARLICTKTQQEWETLRSQHALYSQLRLLAEEVKKKLSAEEQAEVEWNASRITITRKEFEHTIAPLIARTLTSCSQALADAELRVEDIDVVVMVGGSTRVPSVKQSVADFFGKEVYDKVNPDEVVALGAAVQADILAGNTKDVLLLDITPLSLGIETMGGLMDVLIPRNTKIPYKAGRQYTTQRDGQSGIKISVYQGERDLVKDNRKLAEFNLTGIPSMPVGLPKVDIQFLLNADGILQVRATELRSGVAQEVEIKPQYGLTDEEVERMLLESISNAKQDMQERAITEARTEAETMIQLTRNFLEKNSRFIHEEERNATEEAMRNLETQISQGTKDDILLATDKLNQVSSPYAERVMDMAVQEAMKGKMV
jgi:molecular chaperone HscA